jgi:hypothetical protein
VCIWVSQKLSQITPFETLEMMNFSKSNTSFSVSVDWAAFDFSPTMMNYNAHGIPGATTHSTQLHPTHQRHIMIGRIKPIAICLRRNNHHACMVCSNPGKDD